MQNDEYQQVLIKVCLLMTKIMIVSVEQATVKDLKTGVRNSKVPAKNMPVLISLIIPETVYLAL